MSLRDARWLRRALLAGLGLVLAAACGTDEYKFVPDPKPDHCTNKVHDVSLGETDTDCGGSECPDCPLGKGCLENSDCQEGMCIEGFCQVAGCDNGAQDEGEMAIDCGGQCKPCDTGQPCEVPEGCLSQVCTDGVCVAPACDDGIINGSETDRDCGGPLCDKCGAGSHCEVPTDCEKGLCSETAPKTCQIVCDEGTMECDGDPAVACETHILTDAMHCGDCETVCELAHATQSCVSGTCQIGDCSTGYDNCDNEVDTGCETNLRTSAKNCGGCGVECSDDHGTPSCVSSECRIECDDGFLDCDEELDNGCETSVTSDVNACGNCTKVCPFDQGETPFCRDGVCGATVCPEGLGNCDGIGDDCERDLTDDVNNCGRCGGICTVRNGAPGCEDSACTVDQCDDGWDNCDTSATDGGYANGCETHVDVGERDTSDPKVVHNCGGCGIDCTVTHGSAACVNGECRVMGCDTGYSNCDTSASDVGYSTGCEISSSNDKNNCGGCGTNCDAQLASSNATGKCVGGLCQRDTCLTNFGDCDTNTMTCESDFRTDEGDCGDCNTACVPTGTTTQGNECLAGTCTPHCDANHANCDTLGPNGCEIDIRTNNSHCGGCNMPCATGRTCVAGSCQCTGGLTLCGGNCIDTASNNTHCGMCNNTCTGGRTCVSSVCQCPAGQTFCNGLCVNLQNDNANCGTCGRACQTPSGTTSNTCSGGACNPVCGTLRDSCDNEPWDGCEENLASNNASCGVCGRACQFGAAAHVNPATQAGNQCNASGACVPTCATGWDTCDSNAANGCEADITGGTFCGACGVTCSGLTNTCVLSGSTRKCQGTIAQSGTAVSDGIQGPTLTLMHNLMAGPGQNRMIVVGVASRATNGGVTQAQPDTVTYGGTAMVAGPFLDGGPPPSTDGQGHIFYYYLPDASIPAGTGNKAVVIDGAPGANDPTIVTAFAVAFTGVRQTTPLTAAVGGPFATCSATVQPNNPVAVATTGSVILSMSAAQYSGVASPTGSLALLMDNETSPAGSPATDSPMRALAGIRGIAAQLTSSGSPYTVGWNYAWCNNSVHYAVVINPAQAP